MVSELEIFLQQLSAEKGFSANSLQAYELDLTQFLSYISVAPENICAEHISDFIRHLTQHSYALKTINRKLSSIRMFCKFLLQEQILKENPLSDISSPKQEKPLPHFLSQAQVEQLYQAAVSHQNISFKRIGTIIKLMFATGLRVSEVLSLTLSAVNPEKKQIYVKGKGSKDRIVFFDESTQTELNNYILSTRPFFMSSKNTRFLFPSRTSHDGHLTRDAFFKALKKLAFSCQIPCNLISPHTLRHSFATNLINHDVDLRSIQQMLGHENIATTQIYTHITSHKAIDLALKKHPLQNADKKVSET